MIDLVHLSLDIPLTPDCFVPSLWSNRMTEQGEFYLSHAKEGIGIRYYPHRERMTIFGKLIRLLRNTRILNVDDLYGINTESFIREVNVYLNRLCTRPLLDIRSFKVKRIDYCFNVKTAYVGEYIRFLNEAFKRCDSGHRVNHTERHKLDGSTYIKTEGDYEKDELRNYVLNFYDKEDWLDKQDEHYRAVLERERVHAHNVLRLEVQCGFAFLKGFCKKQKINLTFGDLFAYDVALEAERTVYSRVFRCDDTQDFYLYSVAKQMIPRNSSAARKTLLTAGQKHPILGTKHARGRKVIGEAGIYPYCFLSKECGVDRLDNPIKLIKRKLKDMVDSAA